MYVRTEELEFRFNSATGAFFVADSQNGRALVGHGYSGALGFANKPEFEKAVAKGPIPRGVWKLGDSHHHQRLGPVAIPIWPQTHETALGRSGFYIHGDNSRANGTASTGCIILPRTCREFIVRSGIRRLVVFSQL